MSSYLWGRSDKAQAGQHRGNSANNTYPSTRDSEKVPYNPHPDNLAKNVDNKKTIVSLVPDRTQKESGREGDLGRKKELNEALVKLGQAEERISSLEQENRNLKIRVGRSAGGLADMDKDKLIADLKAQAEEMKKYLETVTAELSTTRAYASTHDDLPIRPIIQSMTKLNDVIFNETRNILDAYESAKMAEWQENLDFRLRHQECRKNVTMRIGDTLFSANSQIESLSTNRSIPEEDLPFQLAVRFMFVMWCAKELAVLGSRSEELKVLYSTIGKSE